MGTCGETREFSKDRVSFWGMNFPCEICWEGVIRQQFTESKLYSVAQHRHQIRTREPI